MTRSGWIPMSVSLMLAQPALVVALALTGCGNDEITAHQYRAEANAICRQENAADRRILREHDPNDPDPRSLVAALRQADPVDSRYRLRLRQLRPPPELATLVANALRIEGEEPGTLKGYIHALEHARTVAHPSRPPGRRSV